VHTNGDSPDDDKLDVRVRQCDKQIIRLEHRSADLA
jgi:hypothetical protein